MIPYVPTTTTGYIKDRQDLWEIVTMKQLASPKDEELLVERIISAGFTRPAPRKVSRLQLWSYGLETAALIYIASVGHGLSAFPWGLLVGLASGSALTFIGGLVINHGINTEAVK